MITFLHFKHGVNKLLTQIRFVCLHRCNNNRETHRQYTRGPGYVKVNGDDIDGFTKPDFSSISPFN